MSGFIKPFAEHDLIGGSWFQRARSANGGDIEKAKRTMPLSHMAERFQARASLQSAATRLRRFGWLAAMALTLVFGGYGHAYEVEFTGHYPKHLQQKIEARSLLWQNRGVKDSPAHQLRFRLRQDQVRLQELLSSEGYYGAKVDGEVSAARVQVQLMAGAQFTLAAPTLVFVATDHSALGLNAADIGLAEGTPATAATVLAAKAALVKTLQGRGYLDAQITCETITADHAVQALQVKWCVDSGVVHILTDFRFEGLQSIEEDHARALLNAGQGDVLTPAKRNGVIEDLVTTGLFARVTLQDESRLVDGKAETTLIIEVVEADHRTISAGLSFDTTRGIGGSLGWEHRNIFGRGEKLIIELSAAEDGQEGRISFVKPHFTQKRRTLRLHSGYLLEETDAFEIEEISFGIEVEQKQNEYLTFTVGFETDKTVEDFGTYDERFLLLTPSFAAVYDARDSLLDPSRGFRLSGRVAPSFGVFDRVGQFATVQLGARTYLQPFDSAGVLALRMALASVVGGSRLNIPGNRLLYAGGGGSVRGFAYQSVGPRDANRVPLGGRSLLETSAEWRQRIGQSYGLVVFVDSGLVGTASMPQADDEIAVGAGLGLRYQTPVGPLRFDVGLPVTRRDGDDPFQVYVSIGQAF